MLERIAILKGVLFVLTHVSAYFSRPPTSFTWLVREKIHDIIAQQVVFFTRGDNIPNLNRAMLYVLENKQTNRIKGVRLIV